MSTLNSTARGYAGYRGREGHWSFLLHRLTGLGTLLFLIIHIVDTATVYFIPPFYEEVLELYRSPLFGVGEIALVFSVFFHGVNGVRIAILDLFAPKAWMIPMQRNSVRWTLVVTLILFVPAAVIMVRSILMNNFGLFGGGG